MISVASDTCALGAVIGVGRVVNEPTELTVRPDSLTPIIRNEYAVSAVNPVKFTESQVRAVCNVKGKVYVK